MKYSQERKPSADTQAETSGIGQAGAAPSADGQRCGRYPSATLYHWRQQARLNGGLFPDDGADPEGFGLSSAEGWTAREKFAAVIETAARGESACPARSRRALSTAESGSAKLVESVGSIPNRSRPGKGLVSPRRIGPVSVPGSRPPWIVIPVRRCEHLNFHLIDCFY